MSEEQKDSATREPNREITQNQMLRAENKALRDERDRLARVLEGLSSIIPHQHCRTCNQYADEIKAALTPAGRRLTPNEATE